jgi:hypothetical protein
MLLPDCLYIMYPSTWRGSAPYNIFPRAEDEDHGRHSKFRASPRHSPSHSYTAHYRAGCDNRALLQTHPQIRQRGTIVDHVLISVPRLTSLGI